VGGLAVSASKFWKLMALAFICCLVLAPIGCAGPATEDTGGADEDADADAEAAEEIPSRAADLERDEYSKPAEVFDFVGIDAGDTVIDISADASVDSVVVIRWYHLLPDPPAFVAELDRIMKPGGTVGVVEVRLNQDEGHDMTSHRVGEQTVIVDFEGGGFAYDGESDILRRDDDDYTLYWGPHGKRYMTDRMLLKFSKAR